MSMVVTVAIIATGTGVVTPDIGNWHTALFDSTAKLANKTIFSTQLDTVLVSVHFIKLRSSCEYCGGRCVVRGRDAVTLIDRLIHPNSSITNITPDGSGDKF